MAFFEKKLGGKTVYQGKILKIDVDEVQLDDGSRSVRECVRHSGGAGGAGLLDRLRDLLHLRCRSAGAHGIGENVHLREAAGANVFQCGGKLLLRFPRKSYDQICSNCGAVKVFVQ